MTTPMMAAKFKGKDPLQRAVDRKRDMSDNLRLGAKNNTLMSDKGAQQHGRTIRG